MSRVVELADAVKDEINAGAYSQAVTAERTFLPRFDLKDVSDLKVLVAPNEQATEVASRSEQRHEITIDVGIIKRATTDAEIESLLGLVEEIAAQLQFKRLGNASWRRAEQPAIYSQEHLEQFRQFLTVLKVSYRLIA